MVEAHYPLQALLYAVALHRYLRWRQPGYDPDVHLGGVLYLFLRGMSGPGVVDADGAAPGVFALAAADRAGRRDCPTCWRVGMTTTFDVVAGAAGRPGCSATFNRAGILSAADVHVARRLGAIGGETDEAVLLAAALVVRSTRHGSVVLDLDDGRGDDQPGRRRGRRRRRAPTCALDWPDDWVARCAASPLVGSGGPLRMARLAALAGAVLGPGGAGRRRAARPVGRRAGRPRPGRARGRAGPAVPGAGDDDQRLAAAACALSRVSVLAGGPGTGKTTTVSRLLALLREQHPEWRIALAAPTGKAAARLEEAVRSSTATLPAEDRARLGELPATTLHRLLGWRPEARSRFRHDRTNRLPVEVVVVDEASMVSLTMMARLLEALRPTTRLVLVGDPDQLASVEAGAVLGDLVDRARGQSPRAVARGRADADAGDATGGSRATSGIALLAAAVQDGRGDDALDGPAVRRHPRGRAGRGRRRRAAARRPARRRARRRRGQRRGAARRGRAR